MSEGAGVAPFMIDIPGWLVLIVLVVVVFGAWKLSKFLWVIFK